MDSHHFNPYHHPYYRVGTGVKDHHHHHHHHHHQSVETAAQAAIVQSRILEMRKEKSRDAARSRRGKENHEFYELAKLLPLPAAITSQLGIMNKASIIRLTISYLKLRDFAVNGDPNWITLSINPNNPLKANKMYETNKQSTYNMFDLHQGTHILQSLDGFAFALGSDGRFLYISETVSIYLGLSQVEMTGSSVFDYTHQQDHAELAEQLGITHTSSSSSSSSSHLSSSPLPPASVGSNASSNDSDSPTSYSNSANNVMTIANCDNLERQFCIRMKSTLTKRGCQHFKSSGYRVVHVISHLRPDVNSRRDNHNNNGPVKLVGLVAVAIALPPPSVNELRLEPDMFVMRLGLDFKILHCEPRISDLLDYNADELTGRNMYSLVHGQDAIQLRKCHLDLIHKGQVMSKYYKIMNKNGGYTWIQTCATLICSNNGAPNGKGSTNGGSTNGSDDQEQSIISVNYVISGVEYDHVIMDSSQLGIGMINSLSSSPITIKASPSSKRITPSPPSPLTSPGQPLTSTQSSSSSSTSVSSSPPSTNQLTVNGSNGLISSGARRPMTNDSCSSQQHGLSNGTSCGHGSSSVTSSSSSSSTATSSTNNNNSNSINSNSTDSSKRRRYTSSPVRPWKSPSPPSSESPVSGGASVGGSNGMTNGGGGHGANSSGPGSPGACGSPASNLLRHISVIRETSAILKPQVVAPTAAYHPTHGHHPHHTHAHIHHPHPHSHHHQPQPPPPPPPHPHHHQVNLNPHVHPHAHPHSHPYHQSPPPPPQPSQSHGLQPQTQPPPQPPSAASSHHYHHLVDPYTAAYHIYHKTNPGGPGIPQAATATPSSVTGNHHHHWGAYN